MHDIGGTTHDLRELGKPHPAEAGIDESDREASMQRIGTRYMRSGLTIAAGSYILSLAIAFVVAGKPAIEDHTAARLFLVLSLVAVIGVATVLIALGGVERLGRHDRAATRQGLLELADTNERLRNIEGSLAAFAEQLPESLRRQNWQGFNEAIREGFVGRTGTSSELGPIQGRAHLGLVPPGSGGRSSD